MLFVCLCFFCVLIFFKEFTIDMILIRLLSVYCDYRFGIKFLFLLHRELLAVYALVKLIL